MIDILADALQHVGARVKIVPVGRLADIRQDVEDLRKRETLNGFQNYILDNIYRLDIPDVGFEVRSIVAVASPTPALGRITFNHMGKKTKLLIPSGYIIEESFPKDMEGFLSAALMPTGYHVKSAPKLPHKLLAVRTGLTRYGRNNISYAEGMGSFLVLAMYYSDIPCAEHEWNDIRQMDLCRTCKACQNACPTGAIRADRFLIDNERCITNLNEGAGYPFPDWVPPSAHSCIVGCHKCQTVCPMNREYSGNITEASEFSEEETQMLLEGRPKEEMPEELIEKLEGLNLLHYLGALPRNLKVLLERDY